MSEKVSEMLQATAVAMHDRFIYGRGTRRTGYWQTAYMRLHELIEQARQDEASAAQPSPVDKDARIKELEKANAELTERIRDMKAESLPLITVLLHHVDALDRALTARRQADADLTNAECGLKYILENDEVVAAAMKKFREKEQPK